MAHRFIILTFLAGILLVSSCTFTQKIKDGEMAFDRKQYAVAIKMLGDEYERVDYQELKARKAFLIAESYKEINKVPESIEWYKSAFDLNYGDKALEQLGYALKKNEQYKEAVAVFRAVQERVGQSNQISKEIAECLQASEWTAEKEGAPFEIARISQNSMYSDYAPVYYENGQLVITSDRSNPRFEEQYKWTGNWFSNLYIIDESAAEPIPFGMNINSQHNDGTATFNSDFSEIIFTRCFSNLDDDYCKLMISKRNGSGWTEPEILPFVEDRVNYAHPNLHSQDSVLFFAAEKEDGFGGLDIYYVERLKNGWSDPFVLGSAINSIGDEGFPFMDGDTLYFSSNGWAGMGGYDIFKTYVQDDGTWANLENLKPPFNSGADDFAFIIDTEARRTRGEFKGYFTSSRKGSNSDDIYSFNSVFKTEVVEETTDKEEIKPGELKLYLAIRTQENTYLMPDNPESGVTGKKGLNNVSLLITSANGESQTITTGESDFAVIDVDPDQSYTIKAAKADYIAESKSFRPTAIPVEGEKTYNLNFLLEKIFPDYEIVLENIYYDYNESFIREDAKPSLNQLAKLLKENPKIDIELFSHTDCRGEIDYNINLSQARAKAAVDYLVSVGIDAERMKATGLGESRPVINCYCETCTEAEHQENRRTSFKIVNY